MKDFLIKLTKNELFKKYGLLTAFCFITSFLNIFPSWREITRIPNQLFLIFAVLVFGGIFLYLAKNNKFTQDDLIFFIFVFGMILRLSYTLAIDFDVNQHDVKGQHGHIGYILRLAEGKGLPDEMKWQFYQPPAWHILGAVWIKLQTVFGVPLEYAKENLQQLTLFFSGAIMFLTQKLLRMFKINGKAMIIAIAIVAFHPTFIILSGSINNDLLSITLALLAVIIALEWFRKPKLLTIIALAFTIGFSMMAKLSGGFIAFAIAILFIIRLFGNKIKKKGALIAQFTVFGTIVFPLALWYQVRNKIMFDRPITYVPRMAKTHIQYVGDYNFFERTFSPSAIIESIFDFGVYPARAETYLDYEKFDYNIPVTALKTSVFGEFYIGQDVPLLNFFAKLLFFSASVLAVISVIATVYIIYKAVKDMLDSKKRKAIAEEIKNDENDPFIDENIPVEIKKTPKYNIHELVYPAIIGATLLISYVKFSFEYAFFCSMNFRYIALTIVMGVLYLAMLYKYFEEIDTRYAKITNLSITVLTVIMSAASFVIYGTIA